jgi:hypothetical protein
MGVENSLCHLILARIEKEHRPGNVVMGSLTRREITAHYAAQASPAMRRTIAMFVAHRMVVKLRKWKVTGDKTLVIKWVHLRPELQQVSSFMGCHEPKPR